MRFNRPERYDDDDDQEGEGFLTGDEDNYDEEEYPEYDDAADMIYESYGLKMAEMNLVGIDLNIKILVNVIKMLEKSFFWRFRRISVRLAMIAETYKLFSKLVSEENDKPVLDEE